MERNKMASSLSFIPNPNPNVNTRPPKPARRTKKLVNVNSQQITRIRHPQSSKSGIVLFLGEENSGKSTTLNFLFGDQISPIGRELGTTQISEFQSVSPVENLRIVDVPGFGSTSSTTHNNLGWDTQVLATLKKFLDTDPELSRCIPHVVILTARFDTSSSFGHPNSKFVKTLKAISLLRARLFDQLNANLVIVLTHFMQATHANADNRLGSRVDPTRHINRVTQLARLHLQLAHDPLVVTAENEPSQWNLPEIPGTGYFQLANGDMYPDNLIRAIYSIVNQSKSLIGLDFFRFVLERRFSTRFRPTVLVPMVDPQRKRFVKMFQALQLAYSSSSV